MIKTIKIAPGIRKYTGLIIVVIPLIWIYWRVDFNTLIKSFTQVTWWTAPVLITFVTISMFLQGFRWWMLLKTFIPHISMPRALSYHFIGAFYSIVLPSSASQDIIKTLLISNKYEYSASWAATWLARILGLMALSGLSLYGFATLQNVHLPDGWKQSLFLVYGLFFTLILISFSKKVTRPFRLILSRMVPLKVMNVLENIRQGVYYYRYKKKSVTLCFIVTLLTQLTLIISTCFAIKGITGKLFLPECLAFMPLIELISLSVPFTPNGMGVRETLSAVFSNSWD